MKKKIVGSVVRTGAAVFAGYAMADMNVETLEYILTTIERILEINKEIIGVVGVILVQGWSIVEKKKKEKEVTNLKEKVNHYENVNP